MLPVPPILMRWLAPFAAFFTKPTWDRVLVLVTGAVLAPGRRTVTAVLSMLGRRDETDFARFHGVLNRARWSGRSLARALLRWRCSFRMARWWLGSTRRSSGAGGRRSRRAASTETRCAPRVVTLSRAALGQRRA